MSWKTTNIHLTKGSILAVYRDSARKKKKKTYITSKIKSEKRAIS